MNIRYLRFPGILLAVSLCATVILADNEVEDQRPDEVTAQEPDAPSLETETVEEVAAVADCDPENGECLNPDANEDVKATSTTKEDPSCPSREYVIRCAGIHLDVNKNGMLERKELQDAIDKLPWYGRGELHDCTQ